jgi:hypothetical protein
VKAHPKYGTIPDMVDAWFVQRRDTERPAVAPGIAGPTIVDFVLHMPFDLPELAWQFITVAVDRTDDPDTLGAIAAGPLETLLAQHGDDFIERVEQRAHTDTKFARLLHGVWRNTISEEVWKRLAAAKSTQP